MTESVPVDPIVALNDLVLLIIRCADVNELPPAGVTLPSNVKEIPGRTSALGVIDVVVAVAELKNL